MTNNDEITFDASCGISEEEQREILVKINGISEKNRQSLSGAAADTDEAPSGKGLKRKAGFTAQKSGSLFPILVNAAALSALVLGLFILYSFQGKTDAQVREGVKVYNSAERALIEEIRKETTSRLEAKENEISQISSKLAGIDAELQELHSNNQELSAEQQASEDQLIAAQTEYRSELSQLQDERSRILEESRMREANLQAQLESRTRELAMISEQSAAAIDNAQNEMDRLNREQAQAASVEAQMGALFANLNTAISEERLDDAAEIVKSMRGFLNTPAFQGLRSIQARKELYTQAINSFEAMIEEGRRYQKALASGVISPDKDAEQLMSELQDQNTKLAQDLAQKDKTLELLSSGASGTAQRLKELEESTDTLRTLNSTLQRTADSRDSEISTKDTQIRTMEQERTSMRNTITQQESAISNRDSRLSSIQGIIEGKNIMDMNIGELIDNLQQIQAALGNN